MTAYLLTVSANGTLTNWSAPVVIGDGVATAQSPIPVIGPDHAAYVFWLEYGINSPATNWLKMMKVTNRGTTTGAVQTVCQLVNSSSSNAATIYLKRSNSADESDTFHAYAVPVPAANPVKTGHLYVAYPDTGSNSGDRSDVLFTYSTNGGTNWISPVRVSTTWTNDQWMPVLAVKPDGTQLFVGWYDRRNDSNNSMIEVFGRWGAIASDGTVTLGTEFCISTTNFPPVFPGTLTSNTNQYHYDPVYPPGGVNLHWYWGSQWPELKPNTLPNLASDTYSGHVGDYNGAWSENSYVYMVWSDNRLTSQGTGYARNQRDIRLVRISWPQ